MDSAATAQPPSYRQTPMRLALVVVIAGVVGPLIATIAMFLYALVMLAIDSSNMPSTVMATLEVISFTFIIIIIGAYILGTPIALLAGTLVAIWMVWRPPNLILVVAAAVAATVISYAVTDMEAFLPVDSTFPRNELLMTLVLAIAAAAGCWFLMQRYVRPS